MTFRYNPNPECEKDCAFEIGMSASTCMAYYPLYDKHGNEITSDPNITTRVVTCQTCNTRWAVREQYGKIEFTKIE